MKKAPRSVLRKAGWIIAGVTSVVLLVVVVRPVVKRKRADDLLNWLVAELEKPHGRFKQCPWALIGGIRTPISDYGKWASPRVLQKVKQVILYRFSQTDKPVELFNLCWLSSSLVEGRALEAREVAAAICGALRHNYPAIAKAEAEDISGIYNGWGACVLRLADEYVSYASRELRDLDDCNQVIVSSLFLIARKQDSEMWWGNIADILLENPWLLESADSNEIRAYLQKLKVSRKRMEKERRWMSVLTDLCRLLEEYLEKKD